MAKKKKAPRKKSAKKVGGDDDSEVDASGDSVKKRKAGGGFQKPFNLSETLSALCGETQVRRANDTSLYLARHAFLKSSFFSSQFR